MYAAAGVIRFQFPTTTERLAVNNNKPSVIVDVVRLRVRERLFYNRFVRRYRKRRAITRFYRVRRRLLKRTDDGGAYEKQIFDERGTDRQRKDRFTNGQCRRNEVTVSVPRTNHPLVAPVDPFGTKRDKTHGCHEYAGQPEPDLFSRGHEFRTERK